MPSASWRSGAWPSWRSKHASSRATSSSTRQCVGTWRLQLLARFRGWRHRWRGGSDNRRASPCCRRGACCRHPASGRPADYRHTNHAGPERLGGWPLRRAGPGEWNCHLRLAAWPLRAADGRRAVIQCGCFANLPRRGAEDEA